MILMVGAYCERDATVKINLRSIYKWAVTRQITSAKIFLSFRSQEKELNLQWFIYTKMFCFFLVTFWRTGQPVAKNLLIFRASRQAMHRAAGPTSKPLMHMKYRILSTTHRNYINHLQAPTPTQLYLVPLVFFSRRVHFWLLELCRGVPCEAIVSQLPPRSSPISSTPVRQPWSMMKNR